MRCAGHQSIVLRGRPSRPPWGPGNRTPCIFLAVRQKQRFRRRHGGDPRAGAPGRRARYNSGETDSEGQGEIVNIAKGTIASVHVWLERIGIASGRLFRSVDKGGRISAQLDPSRVPGIFKAMACRAVLPEEVIDGLFGHSARRCGQASPEPDDWQCAILGPVST